MISELFRKWFGLDPIICESCEILREQLTKSERERTELLYRLLNADHKTEPLPQPVEEPHAITPQFVPWRVKQQMLEAEDRHKAVLLRNREKEIADLEKELDIPSTDVRIHGERV